jgi:lipopolysaccharide/colanic/teichoic acid biosynthesis glycosyltransferase
VAKANVRLRRPSSHTRLLSRVVILDVLWGGLSPLAAFLLRDGTIQRPEAVGVYCAIAFIISGLVFQWFQTSSPIARFYSLRDAFELLKACVLIAALSAAAIFVLTRLEEAPRSIPVLHFLLLASGLVGARIMLRIRDTRRESRATPAAKHVEHVIIIEASRLAWFFSKMIEELAPGSYQIVAILDQRPILKHRSLNGYPIVGAPAELEKVITDYAAHGVHIDKVVLAAKPEDLADEAWNEVARVCGRLDIGIEVLPERLLSRSPTSAEGAAALVAETSTIPDLPLPTSLNAFYWIIKRAVDFVVTLTMALLLSPLIAIVCALVVFDVGFPVVFWQQRLGRNGQPLHLYKFRTLQTLFDSRTRERREAQFPSPIGRLLRKTRLDELPQLWNILAGNMSIVGPRPLLEVDQPRDTSVRLAVRPGLTGWAQVCGGTLISREEKNALDEHYIRHPSFKQDAIIVLRTVWMLLAGERRNEGAIATALAEKAQVQCDDEPARNEPKMGSPSPMAGPPPGALIDHAKAV